MFWNAEGDRYTIVYDWKGVYLFFTYFTIYIVLELDSTLHFGEGSTLGNWSTPTFLGPSLNKFAWCMMPVVSRTGGPKTPHLNLKVQIKFAYKNQRYTSTSWNRIHKRGTIWTFEESLANTGIPASTVTYHLIKTKSFDIKSWLRYAHDAAVGQNFSCPIWGLRWTGVAQQ